jgi:hypothetical protein
MIKTLILVATLPYCTVLYCSRCFLFTSVNEPAEIKSCLLELLSITSSSNAVEMITRTRIHYLLSYTKNELIVFVDILAKGDSKEES